MAEAAFPDIAYRVLVLAPTARDAELSTQILAEEGIPCVPVYSISELAREIELGAGAVLMTELALAEDELLPLAPVLEHQTPWSELEFIILVTGGTGSPGISASVARLGNALVLERPVSIATLLSFLRLALSARRRQYEVRDFLRERLRAEEALRETGAELIRSNNDLEQFAYVASHDLQEPLRLISGYADLLRSDAAAKLNDEEQSYLNVITDSVKRMTRLIQDLLAYSRADTHGKKPQPTDTEKVLDSVLKDLTATISEAGATVTHDPLPVVWVDETQFGQVLSNLISNAIKFRKKNEAALVHAGVQRQGRDWLFSVQDNGIGIDHKFLEHVFVMFQRQHAESDYPGTGVGLAICKKIIERHGGRIWVESEPGIGSTFYFTIPDREG